MARRGYYEEYTLEELKELSPQNIEIFSQNELPTAIEDTVKNDDRFLSNTWSQAYRFAAYYYDNPRLNDRFFYMNKFRFHFSRLLQQTGNPSELPDMRSRSDLVGWVCKKHNEFLEKNEGDFKVDCNVERLVSTYGPNYDNVRGFLGEYQYFY